MNTLGFLFAGFALAWGASFVYLWYLGRRAKELQGRLDAIERRVQQRAAD
jgi:CcmD family protein